MHKRFLHLWLLLAMFLMVFQGNAQSAASGTLTLGHFDDENTSAAFDGMNNQNSPVVFTYNHSGSQTLYLPEELKEMKNKVITSMTFKCFAEDYYGSEPYTGKMKLYLHEIDSTAFNYNEVGEYYEWSDFDSTKAVVATEFTADFMDACVNVTPIEVKFDLSKNPYYYTGKTLIATITCDTETCADNSQGPIRFFWIDAKKEDPWRSLVFASDKVDFLTNQKKDNALKPLDEEVRWKEAPAVQFTFEEGENPVPPTPDPDPDPNPNPDPEPDPTPDPTPQPDPNATTEVLTLGHFDGADAEAAFDGMNNQNSPVVFTYNHSGSQVLYLPEELKDMKGQHISSLTFKCYANGYYGSEPYTGKMKLYLHEIDTTAFNYNKVGEYYEWSDFDSTKAVVSTEFTADFFDASVNETPIEVKFDLSKNPYYYTGKTLIATITSDTEICADPSEGPIRFFWIDAKKEDPWRSLVFASDQTDFLTNQKKDNALKPLDNEVRWKEAPAVQFTYLKSETKPEPPAPSYFSGGEGTAENPYLIQTVNDLTLLDTWTNEGKTKDRYFKLANDLTETPFTGMIGSNGMFQGHFDGAMHTVAVDINLPELTYVGLFGGVEGGSIKNLCVTGQVCGNMIVGSVAGQTANGTAVENVISNTTVKGGYYVGGLIGQVITQENMTPSTVIGCANYGRVEGTYYSGGIIGDMGQQVGNQVQRIVNHGHLLLKKKSGGLIGNARPYDQVYYGLNLGTTETENLEGCIGHSISSTLGELFFDNQYTETTKNAFSAGLPTSDFLGKKLLEEEAMMGFAEKYWVYADSLYPRLLNGWENTPLCVLYATPVLLAAGNTLNHIDKPFTVVTLNGVEWKAKNGKLEFNGNHVTPVGLGEEILVASYKGVTRELKLNLTADLTGIEQTANEGVCHVSAAAGALVLDLGRDAQVQVVELTGRTVSNGSFAAGQHRIAVQPGIYLVRIGNRTFKVCVNR